MDYKPTYTKAEVDELTNWFTTHTYDNELDMGNGLYIGDMSKTVPAMLHIAQIKYDNRAFSGQIQVLFRMRDELIKQNKVTGEK